MYREANSTTAKQGRQELREASEVKRSLEWMFGHSRHETRQDDKLRQALRKGGDEGGEREKPVTARHVGAI